MTDKYLRKPSWLRSSKLGAGQASQVNKLLKQHGLHTVCQGASCPNRGECWERHTATFMILGQACTRNCQFCDVPHTSQPPKPDQDEPRRLALAAAELGLKHVVVTMVTRDDLPDGGADHIAAVINAIKAECPEDVTIEVLISDLAGNYNSLATVVAAGPHVLNHNIETIARLYPQARPQANYQQTLAVLAKALELNPKQITKSGFMVGLGEKPEEVEQLLQDLYAAGVKIVTIGQYMQPSKNHLPVVEYVHPDVFEQYRQTAQKIGFPLVVSGPLVRSSYQADLARELIIQNR